MDRTTAVILVFDLGTTNLKAALFDESGDLIGLARRATPALVSAERVELPVEAFHYALITLVSELAAAHDLSHVRGVSFASQANSFALFDDGNLPITPIILWTDGRALGIDEPLNQVADLHTTSGVPSVNHEFAQAKLRWIARHEPAIAQRARKISFISDVLVEWMTGKHESELGLACLTALATRASASWETERTALAGMPQLKWPAIRTAGDNVGRILPEIADRLGLPRSANFYMGCLDQYAGAIGTGATTPGTLCETTGTVLAVVRCATAAALPPGPNVFEGPSFTADRTFQMTFSTTSANLLEWYRSNYHATRSFDSLIDEAMSSTTLCEVGKASSTIESAFLPSDLAGPPGPVVKGIMCRVCDELLTLVTELDAVGNPIRSAGGAARSNAWLQMKADRLGVQVSAASTEEPTCQGAAMLAAHGLGLGSIDELSRRWCRPRRTFIPTKT